MFLLHMYEEWIRFITVTDFFMKTNICLTFQRETVSSIQTSTANDPRVTIRSI